MATRSLAAVRKRTKATRGITSNSAGTVQLKSVILAIIATASNRSKPYPCCCCWSA